MILNQKLALYLAIAVLLAVAVVVPMMVSGYRTYQITTMIVYSIALLGLNILTGYNGQISIGHGAFYAIGAYTVAILSVRFGVPYWLAIPAGGFISLIAGFLFGLPALRLGGAYLALATFALAIAMPQLLKYKLVESWTGGTLGMSLKKPAVPFDLPINQDQFLYYLCLGVAVGMFFLGRNLLMGRMGRAMMAVRDQPIAAAAMGIDVAMLKTKTFGVSAMFTGVAGGLGAVITQYVAPDSFSFLLSVSFVVGIVIGGSATVSGAIYGSIFIGLVPDVASQISKAAPWAIYGACLIACVYLMPAGIHGVIRLIADHCRALTAPPRASDTAAP
jgi:branched-chain amino acid transport system permease protein